MPLKFFFLNITGLPPDITVDEFIQLMSKFGIIMRDPQTEEFKVKFYKDNQGNLKGDGLCCYLKVSYMVMEVSSISIFSSGTRAIILYS